MKSSISIRLASLSLFATTLLFASCDLLLKTTNNSQNPTTPSTDAAVEAGICPDTRHPHAIDLGLGTLWACCNTGASVPWDLGGWYAWGETSSKTNFVYSTYIHSTSGGYTNLGDDIGGGQYDAATKVMGRRWRMPSQSQMEQLVSCEQFWTELAGVYGAGFKGPSGKVIFLPAAGYGRNESLSSQGQRGCYWTSTQSPYGNPSAFYMDFRQSGYANLKYENRCEGRSIRAVAQ